jgi:glycosyltransferase involved in cell wall biosynthesis
MTKAESSRKKTLKVLFLFQGTTHYYNLVLSKLNARSEVDVVDVVPAKPQNLGEGVYQTRRGISFTVYGLPEYKILNRYFFFRGLWKLLLKERPQIIVTTKVYLRGFYYHLPTLFVRYILGIKLILKDHPFRFLPFRTRQQNLLDEFRRRPDRSPLAFLQNALPLLFHQIALYEERTLYRSLNAIVCYIDDAYTLFGSFGVPRERIFITYNSPDTDHLFSIRRRLEGRVPKIRRHPYRIIHVGRLVPWKNVDLLIRAFGQVKRRFSNAELLIVGYGPEQKVLERLTRSLGLAQSVRFLGGIYEYEELGKTLLGCSVYVLAGMGGLSINDAMTFGLPIICSVGDGTEKKLVRRRYNGLYFQEGHVHDLAVKIGFLLAHPRLRVLMGKRSTDIIEREINIHTVIRGYLNAFSYVKSK